MVSGKINILMVDDRPENLLTLEAVLEHEDYNLIRAHSGEEALKQLLKHDYALILLDVQMPGLNGFDTARLIKEHKKTKDIPIIFITAISKEPDNVLTGYSVGAIDYIFKPFEPEHLRSKIESLANIYLHQHELKTKTEMLQQKREELENANQELRRLTNELRNSEKLARVICDTSIDTMITFDELGTILTVNEAVKKMFGYAPIDILGQNMTALVPMFKEGEYYNSLFNGRTEKDNILGVLKEGTAMNKEGEIFPTEFQIGQALINNKKIFACTVRDITERKEQLATLQYQASHDLLTGLPNRTLLNHQIDKEMVLYEMNNQPLALIILDVDHFKTINDTLGHYFGDLLLKQIGARLSSLFCEHDTVARLGGDEFAILLPNSDENKAVTIARQIIKTLNEVYRLEDQTLSVQTSVGIAIYPEHGQNIEMLMSKADVAMYTAKRNGLGYTVYSTDQDQNSLSRLKIMNDLHHAVTNNELMLYYQPIVNMKNGSVAKAEALIRWKHPEYGFVRPDEIIQMAEQYGLIKSLTLWVLEKALEQCHQCRIEGIDLNIAVNLSAHNLQDIDIPQQIANLITKWNLKELNLTLEITESTLMVNPVRAMKILTQLNEMGIKLSIDDFGTGYSSLSYLKNLPVHEIKVDKSFVLDMSVDNSDAMIVRSIINLAHNLGGLAVVAEGIENEDIWNMISSLNCDLAQGYYISRPLPSEQLVEWIKSYHYDRYEMYEK